jgi:hypothetical protein
MTYYITHIKDITGSNYLGIKIDQSTIQKFLDELKDHLGGEYDKYITNQQNRDRGSHHITVVNVMDYNKLSKESGISNFVNSLDKVFKFPIDDLKMMGVGTAKRNENTTYFVVCKSEKLEAVRRRYELPDHDFHITLGFSHKDVFGVRKNEVMKKKSDILKLLRNEYLKRENFQFLRNIENWDDDPNLEIIPIELKENIFKILVGENTIGIGIVDGSLRVVWKQKSENESRIPTTELIKIFKNN